MLDSFHNGSIMSLSCLNVISILNYVVKMRTSHGCRHLQSALTFQGAKMFCLMIICSYRDKTIDKYMGLILPRNDRNCTELSQLLFSTRNELTYFLIIKSKEYIRYLLLTFNRKGNNPYKLFAAVKKQILGLASYKTHIRQGFSNKSRISLISADQS